MYDGRNNNVSTVTNLMRPMETLIALWPISCIFPLVSKFSSHTDLVSAVSFVESVGCVHMYTFLYVPRPAWPHTLQRR